MHACVRLTCSPMMKHRRGSKPQSSDAHQGATEIQTICRVLSGRLFRSRSRRVWRDVRGKGCLMKTIWQGIIVILSDPQALRTEPADHVAPCCMKFLSRGKEYMSANYENGLQRIPTRWRSG